MKLIVYLFCLCSITSVLMTMEGLLTPTLTVYLQLAKLILEGYICFVDNEIVTGNS